MIAGMPESALLVRAAFVLGAIVFYAVVAILLSRAWRDARIREIEAEMASDRIRFFERLRAAPWRRGQNP